METSRYFERTLFYDRSPAADEYYARSADSIFEKDSRRSRIEVRVQTSLDVSYYERDKEDGTTTGAKEETEAKDSELPPKHVGPADSKTESRGCEKDLQSTVKDATLRTERGHDSDSEDAWSLSSRASSTALPTALDQHRGSCPPTYPGPPKLTVVDLDTATVQSFIKRTKNDFRVFYLRQRHSYSRLQITRELFEQLLKSCHVFPRFNEYLIGFGLKNSESEVGPPALKFRPLCESYSNNYHGFGASFTS